jgi:spermidine synthase
MTVLTETFGAAEPEEGLAEGSYAELDRQGRAALLASIVVVALCGIVYELIIGSISSYLLGNSVYQFSLTIGVFMFAMGIGSWLSQHVRTRLIRAFVLVEMGLAVIGGISSICLFMMFPFAPSFYRTVMLGFIVVIGTLVGLEIPLLTRILAQNGGMRRSIASVMSLDYVGALVGSVAFPLALLPSLGLVRASFAIGLLNIAVAMVTIHLLRDRLPNAKALMNGAVAILVLLCLLIVGGSRINAFAQQHLYFDDVVWQEQSPYQQVTLTRDWQGHDLRLFIDGHLQFSQSDEHRYHEALVHPVMSFPGPVRNVLILGGGDGLALREILKHDGVDRIDLVDLDPAITRLAEEFAPLIRLNEASMADVRVHVHNMDAFVFVQSAERKYDRILIDMPDPHDAAISKLYSIEFYAMIKKLMGDEAYVVTQATSPFFARRTFWAVGDTMRAAFGAALPYQAEVPSFGVWGFHLAAAEEDALRRAPRSSVPTRYWSPDVWAASQVFPKDVGPMAPTPPNSIFEPRLYQLYLQDMRGGMGPARS